jgi:hypothetical protein
MLHILAKVKLFLIMSIIDSNELDIIFIHFINKQIIYVGYKYIFNFIFI